MRSSMEHDSMTSECSKEAEIRNKNDSTVEVDKDVLREICLQKAEKRRIEQNYQFCKRKFH